MDRGAVLCDWRRHCRHAAAAAADRQCRRRHLADGAAGRARRQCGNGVPCHAAIPRARRPYLEAADGSARRQRGTVPVHPLVVVASPPADRLWHPVRVRVPASRVRAVRAAGARGGVARGSRARATNCRAGYAGNGWICGCLAAGRNRNESNQHARADRRRCLDRLARRTDSDDRDAPDLGWTRVLDTPDRACFRRRCRISSRCVLCRRRCSASTARSSLDHR